MKKIILFIMLILTINIYAESNIVIKNNETPINISIERVEPDLSIYFINAEIYRKKINDYTLVVIIDRIFNNETNTDKNTLSFILASHKQFANFSRIDLSINNNDFVVYTEKLEQNVFTDSKTGIFQEYIELVVSKYQRELLNNSTDITITIDNKFVSSRPVKVALSKNNINNIKYILNIKKEDLKKYE